ncbi:MAG: uroporphyrinogen decarboxylase family protein [Bacillota bacterium]
MAKRKIPRGELWIAGEVLQEIGLPQEQESLIALASSLGTDICFFSYTSPLENLPLQGGAMERLVQKAHAAGLLCAVTVDGPFERAVAEHGFMEVLYWFAQPDGLADRFEKTAAQAAAELAAAARAGADMLILCDDIAYNHGPYFSPAQFRSALLPLYRQMKNSLPAGLPLGFHSDGKVSAVLPLLTAEGFTVFNLEPEAMTPDELERCLPRQATLLGGIPAAWLMGPGRVKEQAAEIRQCIAGLSQSYPLILASACGISSAQQLERLKHIYRLADQISAGEPDLA